MTQEQVDKIHEQALLQRHDFLVTRIYEDVIELGEVKAALGSHEERGLENVA